jgi:ubiquinone/menaquinone biosynthesis C-methylase UbiE
MVVKLADHIIVGESKEQRRENFKRLKGDEEWERGMTKEWGTWNVLQEKLFKTSPTQAVAYAANIFDKYKKKNIIEVGCGKGQNAIFLAEKGSEVTGLDPSKDALEILNKNAKEKGLKNVHTLIGDAKKIPVQDEKYDGAFTHFVLQIFPPTERKMALSEIWRTLEPGAIFIATEPFKEKEAKEFIKELENSKLRPFEVIANSEKNLWIVVAQRMM